MVSHHPSKFGGQRYRGSGDISFLVVEEQDSTSCLNLYYYLPLQHMTWHALTRKFHNIDVFRHGHVCLE